MVHQLKVSGAYVRVSYIYIYIYALEYYYIYVCFLVINLTKYMSVFWINAIMQVTKYNIWTRVEHYQFDPGPCMISGRT
jgi:hypothetical protein